jgi:hypothetical protein
MIKSKIDARERALELAVELAKADMLDEELRTFDEEYENDEDYELILVYAKRFEKYLIGRAKLPEL